MCRIWEGSQRYGNGNDFSFSSSSPPLRGVRIAKIEEGFLDPAGRRIKNAWREKVGPLRSE